MRCTDSSVLIANSLITGNSSTVFGGAIECEGGSPTLYRDIISANTMAATGEGGGLACGGSAVVVDSCTFDTNEGGDHGGGITLENCSAAVSNSLSCTTMLPDTVGAA